MKRREERFLNSGTGGYAWALVHAAAAGPTAPSCSAGPTTSAASTASSGAPVRRPRLQRRALPDAALPATPFRKDPTARPSRRRAADEEAAG